MHACDARTQQWLTARPIQLPHCSITAMARCCVVVTMLFAAIAPSPSATTDCTLHRGNRGKNVRFAGQDGGNMMRGCFCPMDARGDGDVPEFGFAGSHTFTVIGNQPQGLSNPRALAFNPARPCELWVANTGDNSITIFFNAGLVNNTVSERRQDAYSCHFMSRVSGLAFGGGNFGSANDASRFTRPRRGRPFNYHTGANPGKGFVDASHVQAVNGDNAGLTFATSQEDDNSFSRGSRHHSHRTGNNFMGPTLWSADLEKFAIQNNHEFAGNAHEVPEGSHIDMIHEQPFAMGIAWSGRGVQFWSWDGGPDSNLGSITLTHFGRTDHGFGG